MKAPDHNALILAASSAALGIKEWPGAKDNPEILEMFESAGHSWVQDDETAWCAAFVASILAQCGMQHTGKLNARSYSEWGRDVPMRDARPGDIVTFWRESPSSWKGHVAFLVRFAGDKVIVRGGNQGNQVSDAPYPVSRIVSIRRYAGQADLATGRPVLKLGSKGAFVRDLQEQLSGLRYSAGEQDGIFGNLTLAAVLSFQADNGLTTDGIVGGKTWAALEVVEPKPMRDKSEEDLRAAGSRTIKQADTLEKRSKQIGGGLGASSTIDLVLAATEKLKSSESILDAAQELLMDRWLILLVLAASYAAYRYGPQIAKQIRDTRVADAISAKHVGR